MQDPTEYPSIPKKDLGVQPEPRTTEQTTQIISEIYSSLPPELGVHIIKPNAVLAIAGMKGNADIRAIVDDKQNAIEQIDTLNELLQKYGVSLGHFTRKEDASPTMDLPLTSLAGFEFSSSRLQSFKNRFGIDIYYSSTGFEGLSKWSVKMEEGLDAAVKRGEITHEGKEVYRQGIYLGYPEQAIKDFEMCLSTGDINKDLVEADIISAHPLAQKYHGAVPEFDYYASSSQDPQILEYIQKARQVLKDFYDNAWMQNLSRSPNFIEAEKTATENWQKYLEERRARK